ncbi:hypothetical protein TNCV_4360291 [Trichonephila clavipes]|uniref:Uncharacterized protein n=1 Tax=Trichonephila clavipes TaxID=2585209 RepID=A0A8X6WAR1_TRICX|nr:hypothetical protein TNCV_4360291 [Trichonephila clavipes]
MQHNGYPQRPLTFEPRSSNEDDTLAGLLPPPNYKTKGRILSLDIFDVHRPPLQGRSSVSPCLEPARRQPRSVRLKVPKILLRNFPLECNKLFIRGLETPLRIAASSPIDRTRAHYSAIADDKLVVPILLEKMWTPQQKMQCVL